MPLPPSWSEWSLLGLQHLDLSHNLLSGIGAPSTWTSNANGTLAQSLETLLLNSNLLSGQLPDLSGMVLLSCWSVASNWLVCGPVPPAGVCGAIDNTNIGRACVTQLPYADTSGCMPPTSKCAALLNASSLGTNPSRAVGGWWLVL
jgi:hypothetical protein